MQESFCKQKAHDNNVKLGGIMHVSFFIKPRGRGGLVLLILILDDGVPVIGFNNVANCFISE